MHEVSLGGVIRDYLTGEERDCTTYEDLRQALARFLVEERGYARRDLVPRYSVTYDAAGEIHSREADIAVIGPDGVPRLFLLFCPGQIRTYLREVTALCRLALPGPCPLALVTDMREAALIAVRDGRELASGLHALPTRAALEELALAHMPPPPDAEQKDKESRILHAYTGFLKTCCGESCSV